MAPKDYTCAFQEKIWRPGIEIIKLLVYEGRIDVNLVHDGGTIFMEEVFYGSRETVEFLIKEANADVNVPFDHYGHGNALSIAINQRRVDIVKLLILKGGADVNMTFESGIYGNALTVAAATVSNVEMIRFLVQECEADVNCLEGGIYDSALAAAAYWGFEDNVRALIDCGADVNLFQFIGFYSTVLEAARADISEKDKRDFWWDEREDKERKQDKAKVVEVLIRHGAKEH